MRRLLAVAVWGMWGCGPLAKKLPQGEPPNVAVTVEQGGADWTSPTLGTMKWIPSGTFWMGSSEDETEQVSNEIEYYVSVTGFWLMEHEVTQGEWETVMGSNPSPSSFCNATYPVVNVSWGEAQIFIQKVSDRDGVKYTLPTEEQWEYAARGGQNHIYAGSDNIDEVAWYMGNYGNEPIHSACQKKRNNYGLCDMSGNVWEWLQSNYADRQGGLSFKDMLELSTWYGIRGGSWATDSNISRVLMRGFIPGYRKSPDLGLRLSRTP